MTQLIKKKKKCALTPDLLFFTKNLTVSIGSRIKIYIIRVYAKFGSDI